MERMSPPSIPNVIAETTCAPTIPTSPGSPLMSAMRDSKPEGAPLRDVETNRRTARFPTIGLRATPVLPKRARAEGPPSARSSTSGARMDANAWMLPVRVAAAKAIARL